MVLLVANFLGGQKTRKKTEGFLLFLFYTNAFKLEFFIANMDSFEKLVDKISEYSKLAREDILRRIEAKRAKLSGLVSKEGAAQIVAAELGINFDQERMKISEVVHGMKRVNVVGKIIQIFPVREFNKNGRQGKVVNLRIADSSSNAKVVLWDTNHIALVENGTIKQEDVVEISNGSSREGEIHLSSFSDIKKSKEILNEVVSQTVVSSKKIVEVKPGQRIKTRAFIVQVFDPRYFEVCSKCGKRVLENECKEHGKVDSNKRALLNIVLDDGSETIRAVLFGEQINLLGFDNEEIFSLEKFSLKKNSILGEEKFFIGNVRNNSLYNTTEFNIEGVEDVDINILMKELEGKI